MPIMSAPGLKAGFHNVFRRDILETMSSLKLPYYPPKHARMHEVCGAGAISFAAVLMSALSGKVLWIHEAHRVEHLNPLGLAPFADPARLLMAKASDQMDRLAVAEDALRAGVLDMVVVQISKPLSLTAGRRLQLAAKAGKSIGLCLIPEGMGSNATETRWFARPVLNDAPGDSTLFHWSLIKNKSGTFGSWHVRWDHSTRCFNVVSPVGERPGPQDAPD